MAVNVTAGQHLISFSLTELLCACVNCRRPIEERVVHALGKAWHVEVGSCVALLYVYVQSMVYQFNFLKLH